MLNPFSHYKSLRDSAGFSYIETAQDMLREAKFYSKLAKFTPEGLIKHARDPDTSDRRTLKKLFPHASHNSIVDLPMLCEPEIFVGVDAGSRKPPFTSEQKNLGSGNTFYSEIFTYGLAGLVESFFPTDQYKVLMRFYEAPPVAFAVTGAGYMSHISLIEWVGQLRVCPWTEPFFLGSSQHEKAIADINAATPALQCRYTNFVEIDLTGGSWCNNDTALVSWATVGEVFWKIIHGARDPRGEQYRDLYTVYKRYQEVCSTNTLPDQLVPASLYFGQFAVAVRMRAVGDSDVTTEQLETDEYVQREVAIAIVFLARHGLLYTDLRAYNVRRAGDKVWLVDYDDMIIVPNLETYDRFVEELRNASNLRSVAYLSVDVIMNAIKTAYESN